MGSVFISWSGDKSKELAGLLRDWLSTVIQRLPVFVSSHDLAAGVRWTETVVDALRDANYGIVCVTRENVDKPWLNFEAGAIANAVGQPRVAPLLLDIAPEQVAGPLSLFQMVSVDESGVFRLVSSINESLGAEALDLSTLRRAFQLAWPSLKKDVEPLRVRAATAPAPKKARSIDEMLAEILSLLRDDRNARIGSMPVGAVSPMLDEFDKIPGILRDVIRRAERDRHTIEQSIGIGFDLVVDDKVGIVVMAIEGAIYNRIKARIDQLSQTAKLEAKESIILFTREPDPELRSLIAYMPLQSIGMGCIIGNKILTTQKAHEVAPWLDDGLWEPGARRQK